MAGNVKLRAFFLTILPGLGLTLWKKIFAVSVDTYMICHIIYGHHTMVTKSQILGKTEIYFSHILV